MRMGITDVRRQSKSYSAVVLLLLIIILSHLLTNEAFASVNIQSTSKSGLILNIKFNFDSSRIKPETFPSLDGVAEAMKSSKWQSVSFVIDGHTDSRGSAEYNLKLSIARAEAVKQYLMSKHGIDADRLSARGFGESEPAAKGNKEGDHDINRRVILRTKEAAEPLNRDGIVVLLFGNVEEHEKQRIYKKIPDFHKLPQKEMIEEVVSIFNEDCTRNQIYKALKSYSTQPKIMIMVGDVFLDDTNEPYFRTIDTDEAILEHSAIGLRDMDTRCNDGSFVVLLTGVVGRGTTKEKIVELEPRDNKLDSLQNIVLWEQFGTLDKEAALDKLLQTIHKSYSSDISLQELMRETKKNVAQLPLGQQKSPTKRLALLIGNANYTHARKLANPVHDVQSMARALQSLGFETMEFENATQSEMKKAIDKFGKELHEYSVGLFFYSGHGMQAQGENYLIPIDASVQRESDVEYNCVNAGRVLAKMQGSDTKTNIIVLDACRDNPFENGRIF